MRELNETERLAIAQALYNMAGKLVSTKDPDSLRSEVDASFKELYEQTGSKSFDVKVNGQVVGTYSIRFSKPKESETHVELVVDDNDGLYRWFLHSDMQTAAHYVSLDLRKYAEWYLQETGELPYGCRLDKTITPATEKEYIGGLLKVDQKKVAEAVSGMLPGGVFGLLEANDEA